MLYNYTADECDCQMLGWHCTHGVALWALCKLRCAVLLTPSVQILILVMAYHVFVQMSSRGANLVQAHQQQGD